MPTVRKVRAVPTGFMNEVEYESYYEEEESEDEQPQKEKEASEKEDKYADVNH